MKRSLLLFVLVAGVTAELLAQSSRVEPWRTAPDALDQWRRALAEVLTRSKTQTAPSEPEHVVKN